MSFGKDQGYAKCHTFSALLVAALPKVLLAVVLKLIHLKLLLVNPLYRSSLVCIHFSAYTESVGGSCRFIFLGPGRSPHCSIVSVCINKSPEAQGSTLPQGISSSQIQAGR